MIYCALKTNLQIVWYLYFGHRIPVPQDCSGVDKQLESIENSPLPHLYIEYYNYLLEKDQYLSF